MVAHSAEVGLCYECRFARRTPSAKGGFFWRCGRSESDPRYLRYPPLPVEHCAGFEPSTASEAEN
ncbi:MAG: hypothetical protein V3T07_01595 [Myxococcota bacterium]